MTPIDVHALRSICLNLRDEDKAEIYGLRDHDNPIKLAGEAYYVLYHKGRGSIAWHKGVPAAVLGFYERWPSCWEAVSFGTEHYKAVGVDLMRYGRNLARELLSSDLGARRLQADSRIDNTEAHKFIRVLGGKREGPPMRCYGRDGADYQRFVWLRADGDAQLVGLQA